MPASPPHPSTFTRWMPWLLGIAVTAVMITLALHVGRASEYVGLVQRARPAWLLLAAGLQLGTYVAEAEVWRSISCRAHCSITFPRALALSFAKLFVDQALPTGGVAGTVLATSALERSGVATRTIAAAVIVERATFLMAYAIALVIALSAASRMQHFSRIIMSTATVFVLAATSVATFLIAIAGRPWRAPRWLRRIGPVSALVGLLRRADRRITRRPLLLARATALQGCVIALDTTTMVVIVHSLGPDVSFTGVFSSFMVSSLFRTISIVPGGLGPFEASSVLTLQMVGVPIAVAASATLLFRGLSYWLPMLPGFWLARRVTTRRGRRLLPAFT